MNGENESGIRSFTAGEALLANRRVKLSSGTAVYADGLDKSIGITTGPAASGAQVPVKLHGFPGTRLMTAAAAITSGAPVYGAADGEVNDAYSADAFLEGIALEAADGEGSVFEVLPQRGGAELIFTAVAQSAAGGTSNASEFTFSNGTCTLPAGEIREGDVFRIKASGTLPATNSSDTFKGRLYIGTEKIAETPAPDAVNDDTFMLDMEITVQTGGSGAYVQGQGSVLNDALTAGLALPVALAAVAEDLSGPVTITCRGLFSASSSGNEARLNHFSVERVRK